MNKIKFKNTLHLGLASLLIQNFAIAAGTGSTGGGEISRLSPDQASLRPQFFESLTFVADPNPLANTLTYITPLVTMRAGIAIFNSAKTALGISPIKRYIDVQLKADLISTVQSWTPEQIRAMSAHLTGNFKRIRSILLNQREDFIQDILKTKYSFAKVKVHGVLKDASTEHSLAAPVRFNVQKIAAYASRGKAIWLQSRLISLAFHEHVRHFGFPDDTYELAKMALIGTNNDLLVSVGAGLKSKMSKKLALNLLAYLLQPYVTQKLICKTSLGTEACSDFAQIKILDLYKQAQTDGQPILFTPNDHAFYVKEELARRMMATLESRAVLAGYSLEGSFYESLNFLKSPWKIASSMSHANNKWKMSDFANWITRRFVSRGAIFKP